MNPEAHLANSAPYHFAADLLNKFHTSPDWIQALWLIAVPALIFGLAYLVKETVLALARRRAKPEGELVYSVYRAPDGGLLVYRHGREAELGWREMVTAGERVREG